MQQIKPKRNLQSRVVFRRFAWVVAILIGAAAPWMCYNLVFFPGLRTTVKGHDDQIRCLTFSLDGKLIATGSDDKIARIWDASTGEEILVLRGHTRELLSIAFSTDGRLLATGCADGVTKIWDVSKG
ncbi:MAG: hypothetical protein K2R98_15190 [Gemmataceae bacterium]|nr:hypothetical protein [Gemmataceae bacterium]